MNEQLIQMLAELGADGLTAVYVYLFLEYASLWIFLGLCIWGVRSIYKEVKKNQKAWEDKWK